MGEKMGVKPGAELLMGVHKAEEVGAELVLADRDIQVTLKRTWGNLSFFKKMMVLSGLFESVISKEEISVEDLEKMKERDQLSAMMEEFAKAMPEVKEPLIDERDRYLMSMIEEAPGQKVVAVVGAGHVKGMTGYFGKPVDREAINLIPEPSRVWRVLKWGIPLVILALVLRGYTHHQDESMQDMLMAWILPNAIGAGVFTIIAGGRFLTVLSAAVAAPITSLNPAIGAGMVAGLVEALLRKPNVADCENIPEDIQTVRGFYRNPVTRVLLVFFLSSLGSMIGTWVGLSWLIKIVA
jgi:pheromone shutdown-related protein TraB